jgi:hypothetical protein
VLGKEGALRTCCTTLHLRIRGRELRMPVFTPPKPTTSGHPTGNQETFSDLILLLLEERVVILQW